jgi:2-keto-4-pentenoate hydratase
VATVGEQAGAIANRFVAARRAATGLASYPGELPDNLDDAYAVQDAAINQWGKPVLGWKVGRIASPLSDLHHSDRLAGPIFNFVQTDVDRPDMPVFSNGFAAAEAEFVLRIGDALRPEKTDYTLAEAAELIDAVHVGIEIASSPLRPINDLGPTAIISDFGNNNGLVIGPEIPDWRESGFEEWEVTTWIDGVEAGRGEASSFANGAIGSARFLFELMAQRGVSLTPGQYISSGAVTGVHDLRPGETAEVRFDRWYRLSCRAIAAEPE